MAQFPAQSPYQDELPYVFQLSPFPCSQELRQALKQQAVLVEESRETLLARHQPVHDALGLMPIITDRVDKAVLDQLPNLKFIANFGSGTDNIDLAEATRRGIQVTNTPGVLSESVADLTWGLLLAACRHIVESDYIVRRGKFPGWSPDYQLGMDVYGKTLGIFGLGQIGEAVARRAKGFGMTILYNRRNRLAPEKEQALGVRFCSFEELLTESDFISIHAPLTPETHHCFNRDTLAKMRQGAVLLNTSRGPLIDEAALADALRSGHLYAAGLDVFENEPAIHPGLAGLSNVVLTAHIGSATYGTRCGMGDLALQNMIALLKGGKPLTPVNQPILS